jgi:hypothetical protein
MYCKSLTLASFNSDFSVIHSQGEHTININGNGSYMKHMFAYCTELNYLPANFTTPIFRYSGTPNTIYDGIF